MLTCAVFTRDEVRMSNNFRNCEGEMANKVEVKS